MKILSAEFVISAVGPGQFPKDQKPQIAFAGRSNVGKSSIINALLHRKHLVKTSSTPGKTQLLNFFIINNAFYFVDLPGYGFARVPHAVTDAWGGMIEGYLKDSPRLSAVVVLFDSRREPDDRDKQMLSWLQQQGIPFICAMTKTDKLNRQESDRAFLNIGKSLGVGDRLVATSATKGQGIKELWGQITDRLNTDGAEE